MKPFPHQAANADRLAKAIAKGGFGMDMSDTGTGKSLTAILTAGHLGRPLFVVCPKSAIPGWQEKLAQAGAEGDVLNYERARGPG